MPRFRNISDTTKMGVDILALPVAERDRLTRKHFGHPYNPAIHDAHMRQLAEDLKGYCRDHSLDVEDHVDRMSRTDTKEIEIA